MNGFDALEPSPARTTSNCGAQKSLSEFDSPGGQSLSDLDFEMPPEFPLGTTVGDLASHVARVISNSSLTSNDLNAVDENGFVLGGKESEDSEKSELSFSCVAPASAGGFLDTLVHNVDRIQAACKKTSSSSNHLRSPKPSKPPSYILDTPSITSNRSESPYELPKFVDNLQNANFLGSDNIPLKDPEYYSNSSSENDDFDDFAAFQSAEPEQDSVPEFGPPQNVFKEFADFSDFQKPNYPTKHILPACSLVKNLLIHTQAALEAAFSIDKEAGLNTFVPSELLSPNAVSAFRARLLDLWERTSSEAVQKLLNSVSAHPESFASRHAWNSSHIYSMFLGTIGVDLQSTRFVLPNHGRLKLLEPTPIGNHTAAPANPSPAHLPPSANDAAAIDPASQIPVPEFDWSASGLTNPLSPESITQSASEADLELFEEMPSIATSKPPAPISDLEAEFLHSVPPPPQTPPIQSLSSPLRPLDAYTDKSKTATTTKEAEVPECVSKVLELLPDFSYLRKSILAFPVLDQTD
ncbi:Aftiphilin [Taenia solium]|eukprot:TsM_001050000 transcript=TsM_001050000 gene=TsM_001050000